jgi:RNA polymerase sigma-70 factor (ECF subfamily)
MSAKRDQFEVQVMPHLDAAYRLAMSLARSHADAEDLVQEALLRAFRGIDGLRAADAKAWLLTIVRNCFFTALERKQKDLAIQSSMQSSMQSSGQLSQSISGASIAGTDVAIKSDYEPENMSTQEERQRALLQVMNRLSVEHREILVLREVEDLSYREIAAIAQVPIGTVMSRLARARLALREMWISQHGAVSL